MVGAALMVRATTGLAITPAVGAAGVGNGKGIMRFNKEKNISLFSRCIHGVWGLFFEGYNWFEKEKEKKLNRLRPYKGSRFSK